MHNKLINKYYFIEKFEKSNIDKQDKIRLNYIEI